MDDKRVLNVTVFRAGCEYPPDHSEPVDTGQAAKPYTSTPSTCQSEPLNAATEENQKTPDAVVSPNFRLPASVRPETACMNVHPAILSYEAKWIVMHGFLRQHGYEMRARYQPDWVPSWEKKGLPAVMTWQYEDGEQALARQLDAIRVADSLPVMMKIVTIGADHSAEYARFFAEEPRGADPRNHCLPLLDVLFPPAYPPSMVLIYRRCVPWNVWPFSRVSEATEFMTQVLEGLAFMHENDFVHLDASERNIVMDGLHLYLEPCHPVRPKTQLEDLAPARHMERHRSHRPVKYYFIDFETSLHFATPSERRLVTRKLKQDKSVPEEKKSADGGSGPVDPFAVDVYCIGNMIVEHWLKAYRNVEFVRRLAEDMVSPDPAARPTAHQALARFIALRDALSPSQLRKSLVQIPFYHSPELQAKALIPAARKYAKERKKDEARREAGFAGEKAEQRPSRRTLKSVLLSLSHKAPGSDASTASTKLPALQPDVTAPPRI